MVDNYGLLVLIGCFAFTALIYLLVYLRRVRGKSRLHRQYFIFQQRQNLVDWLVIMIKACWIFCIVSIPAGFVIVIWWMFDHKFGENPFFYVVISTLAITLTYLASKKAKI